MLKNNATKTVRSEPDQSGIKVRLISCPICELRRHPSYVRHNLAVQAVKLSTLEGLGEVAFRPLVITRDRLIIDGYARWELAKRQGRPALQCIEYDLTPEESLQWLIQTHRRSEGLNDFLRIELALDLEPSFRKKAKLNQQAGGKGKGLSTLTGAEQVDSRREIARVAGVSSGNVRKVRRVLAEACPSLKEAARTREISINRAEKWSQRTQAEQLELLRHLRIERTLRKKARQIVARHVSEVLPSSASGSTFKSLAQFTNELATHREDCNDLGPTEIEVGVVDVPGKAIFVTQELMQWHSQIKPSVNNQ